MIRQTTESDWLEKDCVILNRLGLHCRSAGCLATLMKDFRASVYLVHEERQADCRSVLDLLTLDCPMGSPVTVRAAGEDAEHAVAAVMNLINGKFGEE